LSIINKVPQVFRNPGGSPALQNYGALAQMFVHQVDGQPHDIRIRAVDALDEFRRQSLNGVRAGFIHGLAARDVIVNLALR
jgi:hypothetical protein